MYFNGEEVRAVHYPNGHTDGDTVVFFAGPEAFSFFLDEANFTRENGSPKFLQEILHPDAVPFLDLLKAYGSPWGMREGSA